MITDIPFSHPPIARPLARGADSERTPGLGVSVHHADESTEHIAYVDDTRAAAFRNRYSHYCLVPFLPLARDLEPLHRPTLSQRTGQRSDFFIP